MWAKLTGVAVVLCFFAALARNKTCFMQKQTLVRVLLELTWWVITAVVVWAVLSPIDKAMHVWPFRVTNILFVVAMITFTRHIFLLEHTLFAKNQVLKIVLMLLMFPITFLLINGVSNFMVYIEDNTWEPLTGHLPEAEKLSTEAYIWKEMLFFGVGSVLAAPIFAARMMMSIWRTRNRGTV